MELLRQHRIRRRTVEKCVRDEKKFRNLKNIYNKPGTWAKKHWTANDIWLAQTVYELKRFKIEKFLDLKLWSLGPMNVNFASNCENLSFPASKFQVAFSIP